jgi:hypothetical protein
MELVSLVMGVWVFSAFFNFHIKVMTLPRLVAAANVSKGHTFSSFRAEIICFS